MLKHLLVQMGCNDQDGSLTQFTHAGVLGHLGLSFHVVSETLNSPCVLFNGHSRRRARVPKSAKTVTTLLFKDLNPVH